MKSTLKYILHKLLGFDNYLFVFSLFKIFTLKNDKNEKDFFHFMALIPKNTTILDIGANIGIMTAHLAKQIENSTIISFEPMPNNIKAFKRIVNYFKLKNVTLLEIALGNNEGEVEMIMPVVSNVRMQGLSHVVHESITEFNEGEKVKAPLKMLDKLDIITTTSSIISAIKIDVENFEFFVLEGGKNMIQKHKPIIYAELWDNENRYNCFQLLEKMGYTTNVVIQNKLILFDQKQHQKQTFIFLPPTNH
ncbi:MAG: FkbM family methyltransferase [Bacteroidia bacterium]|nr:FkbM family methyltransferase [Bacteroidia bacterium]